ncbi:ectonucleotide pyrophosphatase/phosphodiesterase [Flavobacterium sp. Fl-77]|uniref:Ectonucleotide pyrophosphatase/phosphodiesterase n=1 Tax=Flavobacterium flavipigmentatum TaxID=2893884 RepID=A0AAJ2SGP2_9FLAO|nr:MULTISPECIES: ectonucleotide pyrophosphatase/phosphodiesterase [unclassified Flavobacterium]MDX6183199.1 ectonucleotide pyrophosphatase/phosphodiesterase [Flavobacterium sp. Fl-33]MDX6187597.1 ectonucleotide pyrophosphatase/phosphodiesterase [Flavobacterium sp. Fl-77]UFH40387.1 ectonucleotide pyrophosphatase/phosphodiesterase [Flavobacterium sp. F-70]
MRKFTTQLLSFTFLLLSTLSYSQSSKNSYVVLVSMDGFRWDYAKKFHLQNLKQMAQLGVHAKSMRPSYPSKTFPNHYAMVTGLYPDHHGIINNVFYDAALNDSFSLSSKAKNDSRFYGGNPIWNVAEQQGVKAASFFWPGSDLDQKRPSIYKNYDGKIPYETRIDTIVKWLSLPEKERPHLVTLYFDEPDHTGHTYSPLSPENKKMILKMDSIIGQLTSKLDRLAIGKEINLIIVSDHGMADISNDKKVAVLDYLKPSWLGYKTVINPIMSLQAKAGCQDSIAKALKKVPHIKFWRASQLPKRLHYGTNPRVHDFVIEAQKGYSLVSKNTQNIKGGTHGYDNKQKEMQAIFYAKGPAFKVDKEINSFQNVAIYPLIAHILGLKIEPVDGQLSEVQQLLKE